MKQYTENDISQALLAVANGQSVKAAASKWGIPRSTLQGRIKGSQPQQQAASDLQRLTPEQEKHLADWVLVQSSLGIHPTYRELRLFAERILQIKGDSRPLGKRWVQSFLKRNPAIKAQRSRAIDAKRVNGARPDVIQAWWEHLKHPAVASILPKNRYNADEAGIMEGEGENGLVLGSAAKQAAQKQQPGSRAWTSLLECISALGRHLVPLVIFKGKSVQQQWFPTDLGPYAGWQFTATENGWTTNDTALEWLLKIFIPDTKPDNPEEARLLIMDGHGSHVTDEFMTECIANKIYLLILPPHTSHVLQPLDLSVFSPLKRAYRREFNLLQQFTTSTVVGKRNFLACYQKARKEALSSQNIKAGWRATGLWPLSIRKPLGNRLLVQGNNTLASGDQSTSSEEATASEEGMLTSPGGSAVVFPTPGKVVELGSQMAQLKRLQGDNPTQRLFFKKIRKAFNEKDTQLATAYRRIDQLEAAVEAAKPRKRKKVDISPNSKFANIAAIHKAQLKADGKDEEIFESSGSDSSEEEQDCIVVAVGRTKN